MNSPKGLMSNKNEMSWLFTISQKTEMLTGTSVLVALFLKMHAATRTCSNWNSLFMLKVGRSLSKKWFYLLY